MKKSVASVLCAVLLLLVSVFTIACNNGNEPNNKAPQPVAISAEGLKDEYFVGQKLSVSGAKLNVTYSDDSVKQVTLRSSMISGASTSQAFEEAGTVMESYYK